MATLFGLIFFRILTTKVIYTQIMITEKFDCYVMATSLDKLENKVQIHHLHVKRFHMVKILRKYFQYIRRYSTKYASFLLCRT